MDNNDKNKIETAVLNSVFYNKPVYLYVFKKVSRIGAALYLITDLIKDTEPLKWSLRKEALEAMSFIGSFKDIAVSARDILSHLSGVRSLLEIGKISKNISEMNCAVLEKEIAEIYELLHKENQGVGSFSDDFFFVEKTENPTLHTFTSGVFGTPVKQNPFYGSQGSSSYKGHDKGQNNNVLYKNERREIVRDVSSVKEDREKNKGQRRDEILRIIKSKPNLTIKDITVVIKDCSEKTIQRELISLLSIGLIKKTGERRWSRYTIA